MKGENAERFLGENEFYVFFSFEFPCYKNSNYRLQRPSEAVSIYIAIKKSKFTTLKVLIYNLETIDCYAMKKSWLGSVLFLIITNASFKFNGDWKSEKHFGLLQSRITKHDTNKAGKHNKYKHNSRVIYECTKKMNELKISNRSDNGCAT